MTTHRDTFSCVKEKGREGGSREQQLSDGEENEERLEGTEWEESSKQLTTFWFLYLKYFQIFQT